ncbi:PTS system, mannitol-specific IIA component [Bacillus sp. JCM 19047]|nr:PTS system, mannitol-specific IIA component [Bacillus sp. JCM 19047]
MIQTVVYVIAGEELNEVKTLLFNLVEPQIDNIEQRLRKEIKRLEQTLSLTFNEQVAMSLKLSILFLSYRSINKLWIEVEEQQVLLHSQAYKVVEQMSERLAHQGFRLLKQPECILFVIRLLSSRVTDIHTRDRQDEQTDVLTLTKEIIERFEYHSGVNFQEKDRLYKNLVAHIKPAYYRLKYNEQLNHRYLPLIEHQLKEIYTLTEQALKPLEEYMKRPIPSEEVALIAMHFGGWINRKRENRKKAYKAVVICENGIAASSMLFSQLEVLLPEIEFLTYIPVRMFNKYDRKVDLAFSTTFISDSLIPIIYVPAILGDHEKAHIFRELQSFMDPERLKQSDFESVLQIIEKNADIHDRNALIRQLEPFFRPSRLRLEVYKPMLQEIVDKSMIQVQPNVSSWQEAITIAAQPLLRNEYIDESYIDAMIHNVTTNGPYIVIAPSIAMPHARPEEGVKKLGISMLKLNEPVSFSNEAKHNAQIIIVLAAIDNETHLKALSQLSELLSEQENVQEILASTSASQIETILHKENEGGQEQ